MVNEHRWEEPLAQPLYVTFRRAAELLDVSYDQVRGLSFVLDTRYFGERGGAPRISMASINEFLELREAGEDAQAVLASRTGFTGWSPYPAAPRWQPPVPDRRSRHWRKHWYYNR